MAHLGNLRSPITAFIPAPGSAAADRTAADRQRRPRRLAAALTAAAVSLGITAAAASGAQAAAAPSARAATPDSCIHTVEQYSSVYDSYGNNQGDVELISSTCNNGWVAEFLSNDNTWKTVTVYIEYAYTYGYLQSPTYGYASYADFLSPWYHGTSCYYAEVDLVDNRGKDNWVGTADAGPGC